jgi:hypothetical protein
VGQARLSERCCWNSELILIEASSGYELFTKKIDDYRRKIQTCTRGA